MAILAIGFIALALCFFMLIRNAIVYRVRTSAVDRISALAKQDIRDGRDWESRYDAYNMVSYDEMMLKFWKRPSKFQLVLE